MKKYPFLTNALVLLLVAGIAPSLASTNSNRQIIDKAWQVINNQFVSTNFNSRNWLRSRQEFLSKKYETKEAAYEAVREMLLKLNDPETRLVDSKLLASIQMKSSGKSMGVGLIDFSVDTDEKTKELRVVTAIANTPAAKAGLQPLDTIAVLMQHLNQNSKTSKK